MGWASGSELMDGVILAAKKCIPSRSLRVKFYGMIIPEFERHDCDTLCECRTVDPAFDEALGEPDGD
jgi:hypothetical protein